MSSRYAACTIATRDHLPAARALARSFRRHNRDGRFLVLLVDRAQPAPDSAGEPFEVIGLQQLGSLPDLARMAHYYTAFELCCALRGAFFRYLWDRTDLQGWIFLDSDQYVLGSFDPVFREIEEAAILLSPHVSRPPDTLEEVDRTEVHLTKNGVFNGGFLGISRRDAGRKFIDWFEKRLQWHCFFDVGPQQWLPRGLNCDQGWLNLVPLYFPEARSCRLPGANVGHWNLYERELSLASDGTYLVNGCPLICFHFSGWDPARPQVVSKHAPHLSSATLPAWEPLAAAYLAELKLSGWPDGCVAPYPFQLDIEARRVFYDRCRSESPSPVSPFESILR